VKKLIEIFKAKAEKTYSFGTGTNIELNSQSNIKYPLIWMLFPVTINNNSTNGIIVSQTFNFSLQFLTSGKITDTQLQVNEHFNLLNDIMVGFIQSMQIENENLERDSMVFGQASMINKKMDNIHFGWQVSVQVTLPINSNLCCNLFE
jgi:hypothetical protein